MKLNPKIATFCPGCGHKNLELSNVPNIILSADKNETTKKISIFGKNSKKPKNGLF